MRVERGTIQIDEETFQAMLPVTIHIPLEFISPSTIQYMDKPELAKIIGMEILNSFNTGN